VGEDGMGFELRASHILGHLSHIPSFFIFFLEEAEILWKM
jgi:hypothetical protein